MENGERKMEENIFKISERMKGRMYELHQGDIFYCNVKFIEECNVKFIEELEHPYKLELGQTLNIFEKRRHCDKRCCCPSNKSI